MHISNLKQEKVINSGSCINPGSILASILLAQSQGQVPIGPFPLLFVCRVFVAEDPIAGSCDKAAKRDAAEGQSIVDAASLVDHFSKVFGRTCRQLVPHIHECQSYCDRIQSV